MAASLPAHATILIQPVSPLEASHARQLAQHIRGGGVEHHDASSSDLCWTIKNKYYSAEVGFRILELTGGEDDGEEPAVIVLAAREELPSKALSPLLKRLAARSSEFEVALLVSLPLESSASIKINYEAWEDLAMDNGFEWVDLASKEQRRKANGDNEREEGGLRRVVAALQAHMWEGMVPTARNGEGDGEMKASGTRGPPNDGPELSSDQEDLSALGAPPLPSPRPYVPAPMAFPETLLPSLKARTTPSTTASSSFAPPKSSAEPSSFEDDFAAFVPALPSSHTAFPPLSATMSSSPPVSSALYRHPELAFPDTEALPSMRDEEEGDNEDLEAIFAKLRGVREEAMGLDMEARRALAEKTVMGLFGDALDDEDDKE